MISEHQIEPKMIAIFNFENLSSLLKEGELENELENELDLKLVSELIEGVSGT